MSPPLADSLDYGNQPGSGPLRQTGQPVSSATAESDLPSTFSPCAKRQQHALTLVRDLWDGNDKVQHEATAYLPRAPGEDTANYNERLQRSVLFNVFRKTVEGLTGFIFAKDPVLSDDVPAIIAGVEGTTTDTPGHWENIDLAGTHGDVFLREILQDAMVSGHAAIFVEFPATGGTQTRAAEAFGSTPIRPYWLPIKKENIVSWRTTVENGVTLLTQLVLRECTSVADGAFGEREQTRYRVLYRDAGVVGYRLLEVTRDKAVLVIDANTYPTQTEIPVAEIPTSGRKGLFESDPPLGDLAHLNIAHYQQWSDYATSIHKTCVPVLFGKGFPTEDGAIVVGPNSALMTENDKADLRYVSHDGAALQSCKSSLDDLVSHMASVGVAMLSSQKRQAETAEAKRIDKAGADSSLAVTARGLQDGVERALGFHAKYLRLPDGGSVKINRSFDATTMDPQMLTAYVNAVASAGLPVRVLVEAMQIGGILPDEDPEALALEMEANAAAAAEQQRQAAQDTLQMQIDAKNAATNNANTNATTQAVA